MSEFIEQIVSSSENFVKINVPDDVSQRFDKVLESERVIKIVYFCNIRSGWELRVAIIPTSVALVGLNTDQLKFDV